MCVLSIKVSIRKNVWRLIVCTSYIYIYIYIYIFQFNKNNIKIIYSFMNTIKQNINGHDFQISNEKGNKLNNRRSSGNSDRFCLRTSYLCCGCNYPPPNHLQCPMWVPQRVQLNFVLLYTVVLNRCKCLWIGNVFLFISPPTTNI